MKFTGERFIPTEEGRVRLEHYHRYAQIQEMVVGKNVLDVACGEGYGSAIIASVATSVIGVDISIDAITHASLNYKKPNLKFVHGGATQLEFEDHTFDVVVSFETIEHLNEQAKMLAEIRRVLRPNGYLIISSPNRPIYSEESGELNEFHIKELDFNEFNELLVAEFDSIQYLGQRITIGSVIQPLEGEFNSFKAWQEDGKDVHPNTGIIKDPVYFIALCGAANIRMPDLNPSIMHLNNEDLIKHYIGFANWAKSAGDEIVSARAGIEHRDEVILNLNIQLVDRNSLLQASILERDSAQKTIDDLNRTIDDLNRTIDVLNKIINVLNQSFSQFALVKIKSYFKNFYFKIKFRNTVRLISELFDAKWYMQKYPDITVSHLSPIIHFIRFGAVEGRQPNPFFDTAWYVNAYPDIAESGINPLVHYLEHGAVEGRRPNSFFEMGWLEKISPSFLDGKKNPLTDYINSYANRNIESLSNPTSINTLPPALEGFEKNIDEKNLNSFAEKIHFALFAFPVVSIVIPVYGQCKFTLQCLDSIMRLQPTIPFEIIVIDDCSPDDTESVLSNVVGIKYFKNAKNLGFIESCNYGAKKAIGQYLCFLNNDTVVLSNWLEELVRTFDEFPGTGLVGSKLIYGNGILQEAGGIIWRDGSAWNYGRNQDANSPEFNYAREVDYCSGASIMVAKELFEKLNGFDVLFTPAYCEDCDLALKVRKMGLRVIYQPLSVVVHFEGATSGTDLTQGAKSYQVENTKKLYKRWRDQLASHQEPAKDLEKAKDRRATRRVLVVDHCTPTPDQDAGSVLAFNLMLLLREMDFQVTFIPEHNLQYLERYTAEMQRVGIEVLYSPYIANLEQHLKHYGDRYDLAILIRPNVMDAHLWTVRKYCPNAKVVFHTVDLHYLRMSREASIKNDPALELAAKEMKRVELAAIKAADASIVVSDSEVEILAAECPQSKVYLLPLILNTSSIVPPYKNRENIIFVGGFQHLPNVDAVLFFVKEVMPILRNRLAGVNFYVVGSSMPEEIKALSGQDVIIKGFVEKLEPLFNAMKVSVAPLRFGAGIKGKIASSMCAGLPAIVTGLAAEGMSLINGKNCMIADSPKDFADAIEKVYTSKEVWSEISKNGLKLAEESWGAAPVGRKLESMLSELGLKVTHGPYPFSLYSENKFKDQDVKNGEALAPIGTAKSKEEYQNILLSETLQKVSLVESSLVESLHGEHFLVNGYCAPCKKSVPFLVDMTSGGQQIDNRWLPNWRERLVCPSCQMNNRQRLICLLIEQLLKGEHNQKIYFMEQTTPIYSWAISKFKEHNIIGSEYLGFEYESGASVNGVRHEDIENLSFQNSEMDLIISNDVFEHVPHSAIAFTECARILKPNGMMLATIPFHSSMDNSVIRAQLIDGRLENLLPAQFHGNPISSEGSLVFTDFGWDIVSQMQSSGFSDVEVEVYSSLDLGHLGGGQIVFRLTKGK